MAMINNIASSRLSGHTSWKLQMLDSSSCSDNNNDDDDEPVVCFGLLFFSDYVAALVNKSNKSINSAQSAILTCSTKGNGLREFLATGNWFRNWSLHSYVRLQWLMSRLNKGVPGMCKKEN